MITRLRRKFGHLAADPVLRRWLLERALGLTRAPAAFIPHRPPYVTSPLAADCPPPLPDFPTISARSPSAPLQLTLPGIGLTLQPGDLEPLFTPWPDLETQLAVHRFAWLPPLGPTADPAWVEAIWRDWVRRHPASDQGWAWHPYTAAERAITILDFARRHGLPSGAGTVLQAHVRAIADHLEYFGDHYSGNHLTNNGRGLYRLGLELGWEDCARLGLTILEQEAKRLFGPSGVLNEQSSHYHLLVCRNYLSCWLAALRYARPEAESLRNIAASAWSVLPHFSLAGGMPLVGDISPDCPPAFLAGLLPGGDLCSGWGAWLDDDERAAVESLRQRTAPADAARLQADGWLSRRFGDWQGLWHASPAGWPAMPGHAHQDLGAAELHWRGVAVFIDPGRGAYGETGAAAHYRSAAVHGLLQIDDADPYPTNRPYYGADFRRRVGGAPPVLKTEAQSVTLIHGGFARQGARQVRRRWHFNAAGAVRIEDEVDGGGPHGISRRLVTPWPCHRENDAVLIETPRGSLRVDADVSVEIAPVTRWTAYGEGVPATQLIAHQTTRFPWSGWLRIDPA